MSLPINLLITTLLIYVVGAFISLAVRRNEQLSINISGVTGILGGVLGIAAYCCLHPRSDQQRHSR